MTQAVATRPKNQSTPVPPNYVQKTNILKQIAEATERSKKNKGIPEVIPYQLITVDMARDLESHNTHNRNRSDELSQDHAATMREKSWITNGDTIRFDVDMVMLDGQHKIEAIILSNEPQWYPIVCGLPKEAMETIDTGKKRTAADALHLRGFKNASTLAAATRLAIMLSKGQVAGRVSRLLVNNQNIVKFNSDPLQKKKMENCAEESATWHRAAKFLTASQWAALAFTLGERNRQQAQIFIKGLAFGESLSASGATTSAIYHLRRELQNRTPEEGLKSKAGKIRANAQDVLFEKFKLIYKAWNLFQRQQRISELRLTPDERASKFLPVLSK